MKLTRTGIAALACAAVAASALVLLVQARRGSDQLGQELAEARRQMGEQEQRIGALETENAALRKQIEDEGLEPSAPKPAARPADAPRLEAVRELAALQTRHESLQQQFTSLQERFGELEGALEQLTAGNRQLSATETSLKDQLASARRLIAATEAELKSKAGRVEQLEASLRRVRDQASGADRRSEQISQSLRQIEDINRRREDTLSALQRRYRDVTDQLRALSLRLDTMRDNPTPLGSTDLSRIVSAVQSAEEDLRTLTSLNTQARSAIDRLQN